MPFSTIVFRYAIFAQVSDTNAWWQGRGSSR
jgi:hypothetical protein